MTKQNATCSESVLQVAGNLEVNNHYGLAVHEVKELANLFMRENFPTLRAEAIATAQANVKKFLYAFEQKMTQKHERIDPDKLRDPDIQSSLNDAVLEVAKRGERSNTEILLELIFERLKTEPSDFVSLVASEAIKIVPRLMPEQIGFLTLIVFLKYMTICSVNSLDDLLPHAEKVLEVSHQSLEFSKSHMSHLEFVGCASILDQKFSSACNILKNNYYCLYDFPDDKFKKTIEEDYPALHILTKAFDDNHLNDVSLTSVGQMIGLVSLSNKLQGLHELQYSFWIN